MSYSVEQCDAMLTALYDAQLKLATKVDSSVSVGGLTFSRRSMQLMSDTIDYWQTQRVYAVRAAGKSRLIPVRG